MKLTAVNIQFPICDLIMSGKKSVETRTYPLPKHLENQNLYVIETPGTRGDFEARIVGTIIFGKSFKYPNKKAFYDDFRRHHVDKDSPYAWADKPKWGWPIQSVKKFRTAVKAPKKKGIKFTLNVTLTR